MRFAEIIPTSIGRRRMSSRAGRNEGRKVARRGNLFFEEKRIGGRRFAWCGKKPKAPGRVRATGFAWRGKYPRGCGRVGGPSIRALRQFPRGCAGELKAGAFASRASARNASGPEGRGAYAQGNFAAGARARLAESQFCQMVTGVSSRAVNSDPGPSGHRFRSPTPNWRLARIACSAQQLSRSAV